MTAYLILENGKTFQGEFFGQPGEVTGEIVFNTGMVGYLETISDPTYHGQIVLQTFPLIGNYGVISSDLESDTISAKAYIVKYLCQEPSNFRCEGELDTFFKSKGVVGVKGIDTRALTKVIREHGTIKGTITQKPPTEADQRTAMTYTVQAAVPAVSRKDVTRVGEGDYNVALLDFGVKNSIINALVDRGCKVWLFPHDATLDEIMAIEPHGILLSNGPGSPTDPANDVILETLQALKVMPTPIFGIGLGHQLLAIANGYEVEKLKFGHRGANQPVRDSKTGRVYITGQNHGYSVVAKDSYFVNVNDGTCEGLEYGHSFSVQFHPGSGAKDTDFLYDRFVKNMEVATNATR